MDYFFFKRLEKGIKYFDQRVISNIWKSLSLFFNALFLLILFRVLIVDIYLVPSNSMEDTIKINEFVLASKFEYGFSIPTEMHDIPILRILKSH